MYIVKEFVNGRIIKYAWYANGPVRKSIRPAEAKCTPR